MSLSTLHDSLSRRLRPEDVAEQILDLLDDALSDREQALLERAAAGSLKRAVYRYSSMLSDFARPVGLTVQVDTAQVLFGSAYRLSAEDAAAPSKVEAFLRHVGPEIRKSFGLSDFKADRLNRAARREVGLGSLSRRRYNRMFRHLVRMEGKLETLLRESRKVEFTRIGKSGLATRLSLEDFCRDRDSAAFVAYFTARSSMRSEFTVSGQARAFDEIAEMLLARCFRSRSASFWSIAHVLPRADVLARLSDLQKLSLVRTWSALMHDIGALLRELWAAGTMRRERMVVRRGDDSTTWNQTASAWNEAREHWFELLYALGMEEVLDDVCPGKVLRLMAGDVAAWHRAVGGGLDPDTLVWATLPLPWEVLSGGARCGRREVLEASRAAGVDAYERGWIAPRPPEKVARFRPTPELVHGVAVQHASLAKALRRAGAYSGKSWRGNSAEGSVALHELILHRSEAEARKRDLSPPPDRR